MALEEVFTLKGATCQLQLQREGLRWTTDKSNSIISHVQKCDNFASLEIIKTYIYILAIGYIY